MFQEWLRRHEVQYHDKMVKPQLLELAKAHKPAPSYTIDQLIRGHGHEVLRLPPYHPELNPIELIWSQLKSIVRSRNVTFRFVSQFCY
jgi:transposase